MPQLSVTPAWIKTNVSDEIEVVLLFNDVVSQFILMSEIWQHVHACLGMLGTLGFSLGFTNLTKI